MHYGLYVVLRVVFATHWQLMMYQVGQDLFQLQEESFAWGILVRIHVEQPPPILLPSVEQSSPQLLRYQRAIAQREEIIK